MQGISLFLLIYLFSSYTWAGTKTANLPILDVNKKALEGDLALIEKEAKLTRGTLRINSIKEAEQFTVKISCKGQSYLFDVAAVKGEKAATLYKGLREMGFLFPHPMVQVSPSSQQMKKTCGRSYTWRPALRYRGFHLHNLHPNEWVHGFYMNRPEVGEAMVRWSARNGQNLLEMSILRTSPYDGLVMQMRKQFELARKLEIQTGITIGLAFTQQKSYKLLSVWQSFLGWGAEETVEQGLKKLYRDFPLSYIFLEAGTSEFTPTNYAKTLEWLNWAAKISQEHGAQIFTRAHISSNQHDKKYGNYNFLSQYAHESVGVLPHTVMFYSLLDEKAPMYGNKNFHGMKAFMLDQKDNRPTWYYPETSWWLGMDIDVPLLLTDYLYSRAEDFKFLYLNEIEGHINFTTGHAMGYWLFDWNLALINDLDYDFSPLIGLKLLGEPIPTWEKMIKFQHEWFKKKGLIAQLSSPNLQDELSETERIHDRFTMKQLRYNREQNKKEIALLEEGLAAWPDFSDVKNQELKDLLTITKLRHLHAIDLRKGLRHGNETKYWVDKARVYRRQANDLVMKISKLPTNYPELPLFEVHENPTSYQFGYVYPAASMYWWKREEKQIVRDSFVPWRDNIYDVWNILF